jgi:hypothetical protein
MTPNVDDRLASIIRALTEVVLPHLPPEASLAQEQVHLSVGQLQILRAQIDAVPAFEREELDDAIAIGTALGSGISGGGETKVALTALAASITAAGGSDVRGERKAISYAVAELVRAVSTDGDAAGKAALSKIILEHEHLRAQKDRQWFAPFGFDTL